MKEQTIGFVIGVLVLSSLLFCCVKCYQLGEENARQGKGRLDARDITYVFPELDQATTFNVLVFTEDGLKVDFEGRLYVLVYVANKTYRLYLEEEVNNESDK